MKTIALSMIFSLAVIVCDQQTLFAGVFAKLDSIKAANSLVPIAGVNRSVPVAGSSRAIVHPQYSPSGPDRKPKNDIWILDTGNGLTGNRSSGPDRKTTVDGAMPIPALMRPDRGNSLEHGPGLHDSLHDIRGEDDGPLVWDAPRGYDEDDGPLVWDAPRGYFGISGTAGPGGTSF